MRYFFKSHLFLLLIPLVWVTACVNTMKPDPANLIRPACHIIYDAGSSGTRLYVYEDTVGGWIKHLGPKSAALADPVRSIGGKTLDDADAVVKDLVASLSKIRHAGPPDGKGRAEWQAFDWMSRCEVETVSVLATAGMRVAELQDPKGSDMMWSLLNHALSKETGMKVTTRSITGFEEGLYAWIAQRENRQDNDFGVAEMGGASMQVSFPCGSCADSRQVLIKNQWVQMYSFSFAGWGQDEAWLKFGSLAACELGAGKGNPSWQVSDCSAGLFSFGNIAVDVRSDIILAELKQWYLAGTFQYMNGGDIERFCRSGEDGGYQPESACFRAVYLKSTLETLGVPVQAGRSDADWTLGAVICTASQCLENN